MGVLFLCLAASMVIGVTKLVTTPNETFRPGLNGWGKITPPALRRN